MVETSVRQTLPPMELRTWRDISFGCWLRWGFVGILWIVLFRHELLRMIVQWRSDPSWSHGFLVPVFSLYFVHQRRDILLQLLPRPQIWGLFILLAAIGVYFFNVVSPSGYAYIRSLMVIVALAGVVWFLGGSAVLRWTWLPVLYLLFAVPLPRRLYVALTMPLRQLAAFVAAALLNLSAQVETSVQGVVIDIVYQGQRLEPALNVAEACSGMRLLMAFLALGVAMAYLHDRPWFHRLVLLAVTVPIAVLCNIVRVTMTGFLYVFVHPRYTQGIYHDILGLAMLPLALALHSLVAWVLTDLFVDVENETEAPTVIRRAQPVVEGHHG